MDEFANSQAVDQPNLRKGQGANKFHLGVLGPRPWVITPTRKNRARLARGWTRV